MIAAEATDGTSLEEAVRRTLRHVEGTYGLVVLDTKHPAELVVARNGSPIVLGIGEGEMFVASDIAALVRYTQRVVYLDDGELATLRADDFMRKEMHEQPDAVRRALVGRLDERFSTARLGGLDLDPHELRSFRRVK